MSWTYTARDPGIRLFTAAFQDGAPMTFAPGSRVLEIGCCEADWLSLAHKAWPDVAFTGIDTRHLDAGYYEEGVTRLRADVRDRDLFPPETFDGIVAISSIEHVGLGHYGDPLDLIGDTHAIANCWRWLKPGGWLYFDVPFDPAGYREIGTECRVYDADTLWDRLWVAPHVQAKSRAVWRWTGYTTAAVPETLIPRPTTSAVPFHYVACGWTKC